MLKDHVALGPLILSVTMAVATVAGRPAEAKTPGRTYCYNDVCHRVKTIVETEALLGKTVWQVASFYDDCLLDKGNPCTTLSSGEKFRPDQADNAASPIYPNGTVIAVHNPSDGIATLRVTVIRSPPAE